MPRSVAEFAQTRNLILDTVKFQLNLSADRILIAAMAYEVSATMPHTPGTVTALSRLHLLATRLISDISRLPSSLL